MTKSGEWSNYGTTFRWVRFFVLIRLGWLAFFQYSLLMKQTTSTVYPPRKDWKYYHKKGTLPSMKRTGCQKLHIMKI